MSRELLPVACRASHKRAPKAVVALLAPLPVAGLVLVEDDDLPGVSAGLAAESMGVVLRVVQHHPTLD